MRKLKRSFALLLCMLLAVLPAAAFGAEQIDVDRDVSFTISYKDGETALSGAKFDLYRVADTDGNAKMTVTEAFEPFSVETDGLEQEGWQQLAMRLKGDAQLNLEPDASAVTDENGNASFTLKPGLYLVVGSAVTLGDVTYVCDPFMSFLPWHDSESGEWIYNVTANPKNTRPIAIRKILKIWDPDHKEAWKDIDEIKVDILCDGEYWDTAVLTAENGWSYEWPEELDPEHAHDWSFSEVEVENFIPSYEIVGTTLTITNNYIPMLQLNSIPIEKKVLGNPSEKETFTFILKAKNPDSPMPTGSANGVKEISITGAGHTRLGRINFTEPGVYVYTVSERNDGKKGYTYDSNVYTLTYYVTNKAGEILDLVNIKNSKGEDVEVLVFTNKYSGGKLPQTGLLWWPVPVLLAAGLLMVLMGAVRRKGNRDE